MPQLNTRDRVVESREERERGSAKEAKRGLGLGAEKPHERGFRERGARLDCRSDTSCAGQAAVHVAARKHVMTGGPSRSAGQGQLPLMRREKGEGGGSTVQYPS